jgi:endonuclease G, mitochondrial
MNIVNILADEELKEELQHLLSPPTPGGRTLGIAGALDAGVSITALREYIDSPAAQRAPTGVDLREAIVLQFGRPSVLIRRNSFGQQTFEFPESRVWMDRLEASRTRIEATIPAVGRLDLYGMPGYTWIGTGWLVHEQVVVTNRHVAQVFASRSERGFGFRRATADEIPVRVSIDFRHEYLQDEESEFRCKEVLYIGDDDGPDLAFLLVHPQSTLGAGLDKPIKLSTRPPSSGQRVAVIGYSAWDGRRNDPLIMDHLFGKIYNKKRLAPGLVERVEEDYFIHDCTTLGGNSGSVVIDLDTGTALGLHFAGSYLQANYAVPASQIARRLEALRIS